MTRHRPESEEALAETVRAAAASGTPLAIEGGGTRGIGAPVIGETLSTAGLTGLTLYEPGALTLVARAGTPLPEIEAALAAENQQFPFEPWDGRALSGCQRHADARRHGRGQRLRPTPTAGRRLPRQHDRRALRRRHRGCGQERRPGDEERHRPRSRQADGRQPRHPGRDHRDRLQGAASTGSHRHDRARRPRYSHRDRRDDRRDRHALRRHGGRPSSGRRPGHPGPRAGLRRIGRLPREGIAARAVPLRLRPDRGRRGGVDGDPRCAAARRRRRCHLAHLRPADRRRPRRGGPP